MGIMMLCYNLLYRPWLAATLFSRKEKRELNMEKQYAKIQQAIFDMGSIIYFIIIDHFIFPVEEIERDPGEL